MIRLWLARHGSVPIREPLSAQLQTGNLQQKAEGRRRALARRLEIHPNTVSAVYRDLTARGWTRAAIVTGSPEGMQSGWGGAANGAGNGGLFAGRAWDRNARVVELVP